MRSCNLWWASLACVTVRTSSRVQVEFAPSLPQEHANECQRSRKNKTRLLFVLGSHHLHNSLSRRFCWHMMDRKIGPSVLDREPVKCRTLYSQRSLAPPERRRLLRPIPPSDWLPCPALLCSALSCAVLPWWSQIDTPAWIAAQELRCEHLNIYSTMAAEAYKWSLISVYSSSLVFKSSVTTYSLICCQYSDSKVIVKWRVRKARELKRHFHTVPRGMHAECQYLSVMLPLVNCSRSLTATNQARCLQYMLMFTVLTFSLGRPGIQQLIILP